MIRSKIMEKKGKKHSLKFKRLAINKKAKHISNKKSFSMICDTKASQAYFFNDWPQLIYPGKIDKEDLLKTEDKLMTRLLSQKTEKTAINRLYCGDNLQVLNHLRFDQSIFGKIKLIYIDPPYATQQEYRLGANGRTATVSSSRDDAIAYVDNLRGASFIEFLRCRIILLRELLAEDGSIYVHIDSKMGHYLKIVMDEIFGCANFRNDITRIKCNPKNFERKGYGNIKDKILFYTKSDSMIWNEPRQELKDDDIARLFKKTSPDGRLYTTTPLHAPGETRNGPTGLSWKGIKPPSGRHWRCSPSKLTELEKQGLVEWSHSGNPRKIIYADDGLRRGKKLQDIWDFKDSPYPSYPTEKNLTMLETIIRASSNPGDLVLDCFCGSGTTLLAAQKNNRHWIGIDQSQAAISVAKNKLNTITSPQDFAVFETMEADT